MSWKDCIQAITAASGRELSEDEVERIVSEVQSRAVANLRKGMSERDAATAAGRELAGEATLAAMIERRSAAINTLRKQELMARRVEGQEAKTMRAILTGVEGSGRDLGRSVDAQAHALSAQLLGLMLADLRRANLLDVLRIRDKAFERDVAREMWRLEDQEAGTATGNHQAAATAEILHRYQEISRAQRNEAGAWIGKTDHYVTRQSHDMMKVRGDGSPAAFRAWADAILPKLDTERTFAGLDSPGEVNQFLRGTWQSLASGLHDSSTSDALAGFKGPGNLAKKLSQERKLHFKDADSWFDYNEQFGKGAVIDTVIAGLDKGARDTALMRTFGTNPEAMYRGIVEQWQRDAKDRGDFAAADALKGTWNDRIMDVVTGKASIPGNMTLGKIGATIRNAEQMSKLGGVLLSSVPDLVVNAAMLRHNGMNMWASVAHQVRDLLPKGEASREVADMLGVGVDGLTRGIISRFRAEDGALGAMSNMVEKFHRWNGLTWWTDSLKESAGLMLSANLARNAGRAFEALPRRLQTTLRRYGIEAAEWDVARASSQVAADGRNYLLPAHIEDAKVRDKLQTYIVDQTREGMTEPTAGSRTIGTAGTRAGTVPGEAARMLMQFKTFTATFMQRSLGREIRRDGVDVGGLAQMIAGLTALGYVSMTLKELAKGRNPRIPEDSGDWIKLISAAAVQGGGLGLYGDFLFGENNRFGGGIVGSLVGPTMGNVEQLGRLISNLREGSDTKSRWQVLGSDGLKMVRDNTPFVNLFYTQAALNYLVTYRLQEILNPGYLRRYEQQVKRENNQTFWLRPTGAPTMAAPQVPSIFGGPR